MLKGISRQHLQNVASCYLSQVKLLLNWNNGMNQRQNSEMSEYGNCSFTKYFMSTF
jgi:hypothetical protein